MASHIRIQQLEKSNKKLNSRLKRKITGEKQQFLLKALIGSKIYYKLLENGGIVLDDDGCVVEFRIQTGVSASEFQLSYNLRRELTFDMEKIKSLSNLTKIDLNGTRVTGNIAHLESLRKLSVIKLTGKRVTGNIAYLKLLPNLTKIDLSSTGVTGNIAYLKSLPNLTNIGLWKTGVTGDIAHLKSLLKLTVIDLV